MRVPELLKHIVQVHKGLSYPDFFELMNGMDVAMLAFSESKKGGCEYLSFSRCCLAWRNALADTVG
jgi:hypothetical protein